MKKLLLFGAIALSLNSFGQVPTYVPTNGLVGWYPFNGNADDESGNGNNGTVNGATLTNDRFGNTNGAFAFDGVDDEITVDNAPFTNGPFTIAGWMNISDITSTINPLVGLGEAGGTTQRMYFTPNYGAAGRPGIGRAGANDVTSSDDVVTSNNWHHIVVTVTSYDVNGVQFYVDGNLLGSNTTGGSTNPLPLNNSGFSIGKHTGSASRYTDGQIDDLGLWNRILDQCEIVELYTAGMMADVTQDGATLTADQDGASYQWLDCDNNNEIINGETNQSYTPSATTGNYAVEVTMNGCVDTSECYLVDYTGIEELTSGPKELVKVVDLMGREAAPQKNRVLIYVFSDGTTERVFEFE